MATQVEKKGGKRTKVEKGREASRPLHWHPWEDRPWHIGPYFAAKLEGKLSLMRALNIATSQGVPVKVKVRSASSMWKRQRVNPGLSGAALLGDPCWSQDCATSKNYNKSNRGGQTLDAIIGLANERKEFIIHFLRCTPGATNTRSPEPAGKFDRRPKRTDTKKHWIALASF